VAYATGVNGRCLFKEQDKKDLAHEAKAATFKDKKGDMTSLQIAC